MISGVALSSSCLFSLSYGQRRIIKKEGRKKGGGEEKGKKGERKKDGGKEREKEGWEYDSNNNDK